MHSAFFQFEPLTRRIRREVNSRTSGSCLMFLQTELQRVGPGCTRLQYVAPCCSMYDKCVVFFIPWSSGEWHMWHCKVQCLDDSQPIQALGHDRERIESVSKCFCHFLSFGLDMSPAHPNSYCSCCACLHLFPTD